jgi:hypothetical protein
MRSGAWMLDTFMRIAPMQSLLDRGLSQAGELDRRLSPATWAEMMWPSGGGSRTCNHKGSNFGKVAKARTSARLPHV